MLGAAFLILLTLATGLWAWFNFAPSRRRYLSYRLETDTPMASPPSPPGERSGEPLPRIAIVCPGRNEADMIVTTLPELCSQRYHDPGEESPAYRVIYVDDQSEDATPRITAQWARQFPHLLVVRNEAAPPPGWVGKCWAVRQGYQALLRLEATLPPSQRAQWVCFTDADIHWSPDVLRQGLPYLQSQGGDVLALFPRLVFGSRSEAIAQTTMVLALGLLFPFEKAMDPRHPDTITGGAFMLVRREYYDRIGGHEAVKGFVVEDINLGRKLKAAGARIRIAVTRSLLHCRMYEGWSDMWEGLTKNAYAGLEYRWERLAGFLGVVLLANVLAPAYLAGALAWLLLGGGWAAGAAVALAVALNLLHLRPMNVVRRLLDLPWWYACTVPAGSAVYSLFMIASAWRYYRGGNRWKGRAYGPATVQAETR